MGHNFAFNHDTGRNNLIINNCRDDLGLRRVTTENNYDNMKMHTIPTGFDVIDEEAEV